RTRTMSDSRVGGTAPQARAESGGGAGRRRPGCFTRRDGSAPGLVRRGAIDGRHLSASHAQVDAELSTVVDVVVQQEPEEIHVRDVAHGLRRDEEGGASPELILRGSADG